MLRTRVPAVVLGSVLAWFGAVGTAEATPFQVAITSAGTNTIVDNQAGDSNLTVGIIQADVVNNFYNISVLATLVQTPTGATITNQVTAVDTVSLGAATISVTASYDEFLFALPGASVTAASSLSVAQLESQDTAALVSALDGTSSGTVGFTGPDPVGPGTVFFTDVIGSNPFVMANTIFLNGLSGVGQTAIVTGQTSAPVAAVPEPGTLLLLGGGLLATAVARRRRRSTNRA